VVGLFDDAGGDAARVLDEVAVAGAAAGAATGPAADLVDDESTRHRLWVVSGDGEADGAAAALMRLAGAASVTIADGHHRYETALRYRDERRMSRSCEEDPPFDYLLALLLPVGAAPLTVLPTHRVVQGVPADDVERLWAGLGELFDVAPAADAASLVARFEAAALEDGGAGRFGLWAGGRGATLGARRAGFEPILPRGGDALRGLDVVLLGAALERLLGIDAGAVAEGSKIGYTKSAREAVERVHRGADGAAAAFLLEPTPIASIAAVAADGDVMPQKSTYFYPKALTGLVINPHEW
jgi:uncharacterized protein (DUF1015 family)